jgi:tripartite-type tricarboxylate transporter receptor subunit TctC
MMKLPRRQFLHLAAGAAALPTISRIANAQAYPTKPITLIVPAAAGGPTDTIARVVAQVMSTSLGQQIVIENVGGAGGTIAIGRAAHADADGYTLLICHVQLASTATLYRTLSYDAKSAFAPIGLITDAPMTIIGRSDLPPNSLAELINYVKAQGTKVTMANAGIGSASHLCGMLFMAAVQKRVTAVPYRGTGPVMTDLLGNQIDLTCDQVTNTSGPILAKKVKAYAITTKARLETLPDLPTADEAGLPGFEFGIWHGLFAPKRTPAAVLQRLSQALRIALKDAELQKHFAEINTLPIADDRAQPEILQKLLLSEIDRWAEIIKSMGEYAD